MSGIASFIAGLGTGIVSGSRYQDEQERLKKKDQMDQETHDAQMDAAADAKTERKQKLANEKALRDAAAPVAVTQGADVSGISGNGPAQYDSADVAASDVRQATTMADATGNAAPAVTVAPKFAAGGIRFDDPAAAQAAATAANAPQARQQRMQTAMEQTGDFAGAASLRSSNLQAQAAQQTLSDSIWKHDLGAAMQMGHDGLADLVSKSEAGPMSGHSIKAVPSPDGKTVTYNKVGADGSMTPTNLTFSNDQAGIAQAAYMLDKTVTPEHRVEYAIKSAKTDAEVKELNAKAGYWEANGQKQSALAANGGTAKKADHFDEKEWNNAAKIDKGVVSLPNAFGDKDVESGDLRSAYLQVFNAAKSSGDFAPNEAVEHATTTVVRLKNAAQARVDAAKAADPKSALTIDQAVRSIMKEAQAAKPAASATPGTAPAPTGAASGVPGKPGPNGTVYGPNGHATVPTGTQTSMDAAAGQMIIRSEYGGDVDKAKADIAQADAAIARAKGDQKAILQGWRNRVQAGVDAMQKAPPAAAAPAAAPAAPIAAQGITPAASAMATVPAATVAAQGVPAQPASAQELVARAAAARATLRSMQAKAPGLSAGRAALEAYAAKVAQAKADLEQAEAQASAAQTQVDRDAFMRAQANNTGPAFRYAGARSVQ
jgi:hypothetical protein